MDDIFEKIDDIEEIDVETNTDKQRRINYGLTFSTREGFEVLMDIMKFCHAHELSYVRGDQRESDLREGERNVFLYIMSQLSDEMKQKTIIGG